MAEIALKLATQTGEKLVENLVNKLYESISGEISLLRGVREEVQYIIDELEMMSAFLREAEEKQATNEAARTWVKQVRQLSYIVEDCIDEFSLHLEQHKGKNLKARHQIASQIQSVKSRVQEVSSRRSRYGIVEMNKPSSDEYNVAQYDPQSAALFIEDTQLVGIDEPIENLVGRLMDETAPELRLIAAVGGGGMGKTTIVRKVYENPNVTDGHFTCRAWITVSHMFNIEDLLRAMIRQLFRTPPDNLDKTGRPQLITNLRSYLHDKSYIIVFDDLWKIDAWKSLEMALPKNDLGSRVMITTRNRVVAEACTNDIPGYIYLHKKLSPEQSMTLFCRRAFKNNCEHICPEEFEKLTKDILEKCDGLPLAIVCIAGVLANKTKGTIQEWESVLRSLGSELEINPMLEGMKHVLSFSYNDLPYHVKRCFLYLSKFPEDYLIERKHAQRLWIAEGFVAGRRGMAAGAVAESYFNELINRFLIIPSSFSANGKVKSFRVHDIMLELLVSKSMEDDFLSLLGNDSSWMPRHVARRLSVHAENNTEDMSMSRVRSLSIFGDGVSVLTSASLRLLRVLDLEGCGSCRTAHLHIIAKSLQLLKFLSLRRSSVDELPEFLGNLRSLETLDVRASEIIKIPASVLKLQHLRFLRGGLRSTFRRGGGLYVWPPSGIEVPRGIGSLKALEELAAVDLSHRRETTARHDIWKLAQLKEARKRVVEIGKLTQLRKLAVVLHPEDSGEDFCRSLDAISRSLRSLKVHSHGSLSFLNNLSSPPLLLETLWLNGRLGRLPSWVGSLHNVVKLLLSASKLEDSDDDTIRALGSLPNLIDLELGPDVFSSDLRFGSQGFPRLKVLCFQFSNKRSLSFEGGAMPCLESVSFHPYDDIVPKILGIRNLPRLKEIELLFDRTVTRLPDVDSVRTQVDEHLNRPRLTVR